MQHFILRCKHCGREYVYCTYGNGSDYGTEEGCSMDYCSDCQKAIDTALSAIPVKFRPCRKEITDEKEKEELFLRLSEIRSEYEKPGCFHVVSAMNSSEYDNVDSYMYKGCGYYIEYNDATPDEKHLSVDVEYDILKGKVGERIWRYDKPDSYIHGRSMKSLFVSFKHVSSIDLSEPSGLLFYNDFNKV